LSCVAAKPTQFSPPLVVQPGRGGLPTGFCGLGLVEVMLKPVWE
jgi:hypothetical protein